MEPEYFDDFVGIEISEATETLRRWPAGQLGEIDSRSQSNIILYRSILLGSIDLGGSASQAASDTSAASPPEGSPLA
jgi:hypothetical protein